MTLKIGSAETSLIAFKSVNQVNNLSASHSSRSHPVLARKTSAGRKSQREASPEAEESEVVPSQQGEESEIDRIIEEAKQKAGSSSSPPPQPTVLSSAGGSARGKAAASKSKSPRRKFPSTDLPRKRKAIEALDEPAPEDDEGSSKEPVATPPVDIRPPPKKKRPLVTTPTEPDNSSTNAPPHQDPETQLPKSPTGPTTAIIRSLKDLIKYISAQETAISKLSAILDPKGDSCALWVPFKDHFWGKPLA